MSELKKLADKIVPQWLINWYHFAQSLYYASRYGHPAEEMIVIGVTGSKGKTTTANMIWSILQTSGQKTGLTGTANFRIGQREELNPYHMTMPGPAILQKYLRLMANEGCRYVVIETPSEGQAQYRHVGINYDVVLFTNLTHEILKTHHYSTDVLKKHNARIFQTLSQHKHKSFDEVEIQKTIVANNDAPESEYYLQFVADKKITYAVHKPADLKAKKIRSNKKGVEFEVDEITYTIPILGEFNVTNALAAIAVAQALDISADISKQGLENLPIIPGRMELIDEAQDFTVIVDYAHEQTGLQLVLESMNKMKPLGARLIVHLGAEGGGRDIEKRPIMGELAARLADYTIIGNVDPYDDDPKQILDAIAQGALQAGAKLDENLFIIEDRRAGIRRALQLARKNDIVVITGKGAEQSMLLGPAKITWDDRSVVRQELKKLK